MWFVPSTELRDCMCSNAMSYGFSIHKLRGISRSSVINTGLRPTKAPSERWVFSASSAKRSKYSPRREKASTLFLEVEEDGSDAWKLDPVIDMLEGGLVGILPTDSYPAFVCDPNDKAAVELLYRLKGASASKQLSFLCRDFRDISRYTLGFPSLGPGEPDLFRFIKSNRILPGPYTFIMQASKEVPKQVTNFETGHSKRRSTVGIRMPNSQVCQSILQRLHGPLICSSAVPTSSEKNLGEKENDVERFENPSRVDGAVLADIFGPQGLAFVVQISGRYDYEPSTVIDFSGTQPQLLRQGQGDASWLPV